MAQRSLLLTFALAACSARPDERPASTPAPTPTTSAPAPPGSIDAVPPIDASEHDGPSPRTFDANRTELERHLAAVNALVPPDWRSKLRFELVTMKLVSFREVVWLTAAIPVGWERGDYDNFRRAPDAAADSFHEPGFRAEVFFGHERCSGPCDAEKTGRQFVFGEPETTIEARREANLRLAVIDTGSILTLIVTRWRDGAERYYSCNLQMPKTAAPALPAFKAACSLFAVSEDHP